MRYQDLYLLPIAEVARLIQGRKLSPVELVSAYLDRIDAVDKEVNAYITLMREAALSVAAEAEKAISRGEYKGPLHGVPVGLKDLFSIKGIRTTAGTEVMADLVPTEDCTVALKLKDAGAIILGKLNMTELAYDPTGENIHYGDVRNPWSLERMSGGSSSGSAAAVVAGECAAALGSDTGGSIRIPASLCGAVGLKPTFGRVSLYGVYPLAWSLDHAGPIARTAEDCAILLNAIAGYDAVDPVSVDVPVPDFTSNLAGGVKALRIGLPQEHGWAVLSDSVRWVAERAVKTLAELGATVTDVSLPAIAESHAISGHIQVAEALVSDGEILRNDGNTLSTRVRQRLESGLAVTVDQYIRAQQARARMIQETRELLRNIDVLALPTCPVVAPPHGISEMKFGGMTLGSTAALTYLTRFANLTGLPAISVPCGFSEEGLPVGLQLIGRPFEEATVLRAAYAYEQATEWHGRHPSL
ncbi:MAG: amidase [Chloroflexi bacterium]|nr:amidase [Chloroflexota bacterium]